jgi:transcriptional regulator with XRE-family HTH domain
MPSAAMSEKPAPSELGALLKDWRARRGKSQLDLSLDTGVSQRHISFVERSIPDVRFAQTLANRAGPPKRPIVLSPDIRLLLTGKQRTLDGGRRANLAEAGHWEGMFS